MANTFKFGNGQWAVGKETALAYNDENSNFKPLPFSFDRASTATVVNKNGLIETVGVDEPRIDFLNNTKGHLLLEPSRQNKLLQSNQFDTTWILGSTLSLTGGQTSALTGNNDAWLLSSDGTSGFGQINQSVSFSGSHVFSVFAKKGTNDIIAFRSLSGLDVRAQFNLNTGILVGASNTTSTEIKSYGNGWYRVSMTFSATNTNVYIYPNEIGAADEGNIYIQNAQLEAGSYATSYIPTSGSAVTRSVETCVDAGNSTVFNDSEGVLYVEMAALADDQTNRRITISDGSNNNRIVTGYNTNSNYIFYFIIDGGSTVATGSYQLTDIKDYHKVGIKWKQNDFALWIDGVERHTDSSGTTPSGLDSLQFEQGSGGALYFYGKTKDLRVYNTALSDSELQALTS